jgi:hypothetical protein
MIYYLLREQTKTSGDVEDDDPFINNNKAEGSTHSKATSQSLEIPIGTENAGSSRGATSGVNKVISSECVRPHTPPHQIVRNTYNQEISINENILIMSAKNLASLDESKVFD